METIRYLLIGLVIGIISGSLGIGGGVLLVPALMMLCRFDFPKAAGTTLAVLVPPIGLPAAWKYYTMGRMDLIAALWIALAFAIGAFMGATAVPYLPVRGLRIAFGLMMIYIAMRFIVGTDSTAVHAGAGLTAVILAWAAFLGLRALGRKHQPRPSLQAAIHAVYEEGRAGTDYHI